MIIRNSRGLHNEIRNGIEPFPLRFFALQVSRAKLPHAIPHATVQKENHDFDTVLKTVKEQERTLREPIRFIDQNSFRPYLSK